MIEFLTNISEFLTLIGVVLIKLMGILMLVGVCLLIWDGAKNIEKKNREDDIDEELARQIRTLKKAYPDKTVKAITIRNRESE